MIPDIKFYQHVSYEINARWPIKLSKYVYDKGIIYSLRRRTKFKNDAGQTLYTGNAMRYRRSKRK